MSKDMRCACAWSFPEHFLASMHMFFSMSDMHVRKATSFTDANEFSIDLSNFKRWGGKNLN